MIKYCNRFFRTEQEAKAFQKQFGRGTLYKNVKGSRSKQKYLAEVAVAGQSEAFADDHPYVIAWNEKQ